MKYFRISLNNQFSYIGRINVQVYIRHTLYEIRLINPSLHTYCTRLENRMISPWSRLDTHCFPDGQRMHTQYHHHYDTERTMSTKSKLSSAAKEHNAPNTGLASQHNSTISLNPRVVRYASHVIKKGTQYQKPRPRSCYRTTKLSPSLQGAVVRSVCKTRHTHRPLRE